MSDPSLSHLLSIGHDLLIDDESYLHYLSEEELGSISGGGMLKTTGPATTAINCTVCPPTKTIVVTTAISCTCDPGPKPTPPLPTPPVVIDPCPQPMTTAWFCTLY